jgi:hypothetical protein
MSSYLATRESMEIKDGVNTVLGADINDAVEVLESFNFQDTGVHVVYHAPKGLASDLHMPARSSGG